MDGGGRETLPGGSGRRGGVPHAPDERTHRSAELAASSGETTPQMSPGRQLLLAAASGALLVLAFPPVDFTPAAFVALVPIFHAVSGVRGRGLWSGFRLGFLAGVVFFLALLHWLVLLSSAQMNDPVTMSGPLALLVLLQSLYWGFFSATSVFVLNRTAVPRVLVLPVLWVAFEQLRSLGVIGFTWGAVGYAAVPIPAAIQFVSVTGMFGASFWIVLVNALVLEIGVSSWGRSGRGRTIAFATALVLSLALPIIHGVWETRSSEWKSTMTVAVLQPNIPGEIKWDAAYKSASFEALESLSLAAAVHRPDLIVWPETAAPSYLLRDRVDLARVGAIAQMAGAPILTGCPDIAVGEEAGEGLGRALNSVLLIDTDGVPRAKYDKMKLVPFGEVIPFETVVPFLRSVDFGEADFWPGRDATVFELPEGRFSALVCYEATFPRMVRRFVNGGAELLVNVTNDVWYGRSAMPFQHASMAIMRCIEHRRSLARSANSGVSMMVDPHGRVIARTGIFERVLLVDELPVVSDRTFYARAGDLFPWCAVAAGALMAILGVWRRQRPISSTEGSEAPLVR
jgi:apolipoprotein N-acyltransferase